MSDTKPIGERIATLETEFTNVKEDLARYSGYFERLFTSMEAQQNNNTETSLLLKQLTESVGSQHTPDACPLKPKVDRLWVAFVAASGIIAVLAAIGLLDDVGTWLISQVKGGS